MHTFICLPSMSKLLWAVISISLTESTESSTITTGISMGAPSLSHCSDFPLFLFSQHEHFFGEHPPLPLYRPWSFMETMLTVPLADASLLFLYVSRHTDISVRLLTRHADIKTTQLCPELPSTAAKHQPGQPSSSTCQVRYVSVHGRKTHY